MVRSTELNRFICDFHSVPRRRLFVAIVVVVVFSIHRAHGVGFTQRALFLALPLFCVYFFLLLLNVEFAFSCHVE